jgi:hypothetical protein
MRESGSTSTCLPPTSLPFSNSSLRKRHPKDAAQVRQRGSSWLYTAFIDSNKHMTPFPEAKCGTTFNVGPHAVNPRKLV